MLICVASKMPFDNSGIMLFDHAIELRFAHIKLLHSRYCTDSSVAPLGEQLFKVRILFAWTAKVLALRFCCIYSFSLTLANSNTFLFCNSTEHFNKNIVYHVEYPFLSSRKVHHSCRKVDNLKPYAVIPEPLQLIFYIFFAG